MIADAHVHVGYYNCRKSGSVEYYSPRRVIGVLNRCGTDEFIVSSTSAQASPVVGDLIEEAEEIKRQAGARAHIFDWVTWRFFQQDRKLVSCVDGLYEGIKLHEQESHWIEHHYEDLLNVLDIANERHLPVQFHCGPDAHCSPSRLMGIAQLYPNVRFNFAHCRPMDEMASVIARCDNVWTDTAYMALEDFEVLPQYNWRNRLMFGTDIPVWQGHEEIALTRRYRDYVTAFARMWPVEDSNDAFRMFLFGTGRKTATSEALQINRKDKLK